MSLTYYDRFGIDVPNTVLRAWTSRWFPSFNAAGVVRYQTGLLCSMLMQHMNDVVTHSLPLRPGCTVPHSKHYMWVSEKENFVSSALEVFTDNGPQ